MKKILCTLAIVGVAASAFAQGQLVFQNTAATVVKWKEPGAADSTAQNIGNNGGFVQLIWAPTGSAATTWSGQTLTEWLGANSAWKSTDVDGNAMTRAIGPIPGVYLGGTKTLATTTPGGIVDVYVLAWRGSATSFDAAVAEGGYAGFSPKFTVDTGNPNATPIAEPATALADAGLTGFIITSIPEPSSLALAGLGAAALLIFRRRK